MMNRKTAVLMCILLLWFSGCTPAQNVIPSPEESRVSSMELSSSPSAKPEQEVDSHSSEPQQSPTPSGAASSESPTSEPEQGTDRESASPEPSSPPGPAEPREWSTYRLLEGTELELEVAVLTTEIPGPTLFVVAGIHGDEIAGWMAAQRLLEESKPTRGTLYVLSPANRPGASAQERYCYDDEDLNRLFPGNANGTRSQRVADAIYRDVRDKNSDLVLDLHEAIVQRPNRDFLGNSFIYTSLEGMEDLFFELLLATESGEICSQPFHYFAPGVAGSINNAVSTGLKIPIITVETFRKDDLEVRIQNHLDVVHFIMGYLKME